MWRRRRPAIAPRWAASRSSAMPRSLAPPGQRRVPRRARGRSGDGPRRVRRGAAAEVDRMAGFVEEGLEVAQPDAWRDDEMDVAGHREAAQKARGDFPVRAAASR